MEILDIFQMPKPVKIRGRTSTITNAFVTSIIPRIPPTTEQLRKCLRILRLDEKDLRCAYCGDKWTEWDHLRPIVEGKKPTGYISDIYNLVPSCGKCNQSKQGGNWKDWITSDVKWSPKTRRIPDLKERIKRLEEYEKWTKVTPMDFETIIGKKLWAEHWKNCEKIHEMMRESQIIADQVQEKINTYVSSNSKWKQY